MLPNDAQFGVELEGHGEIPREWSRRWFGTLSLSVPLPGEERWDIGEDGSLAGCNDCKGSYDCHHECDSDCSPCSHECSGDDEDCTPPCTSSHHRRNEGSAYCVGFCQCRHDCSDDCISECTHECDHNCSNSETFELRSPPLRGEKGLAWIAESLGPLIPHVHTARDCGFHVHISVRSAMEAAGMDPYSAASTLLMLRRVQLAYRRCWTGICAMVSESRWDNSYCYRPSGVSGLYSLEDVASQDRYQAVNTSAYGKYATVEYRQHQGCFDTERIAMWVRFLWEFTLQAARGAPRENLESLKEVFDYARPSSEVQNYYMKEVA